MVFWQKFDPTEFQFEFAEEELAAHGITVDEALEVIWNGFDVRRNKSYHGGYQIIGSHRWWPHAKAHCLPKTSRCDSGNYRMGRMKARKKISEAEIEQQLIADAEDPDAWEAPIAVPPSRTPRPEWYGRKYYQPAVKPEVAHKSFAKRRRKASKRSKFDTR